MEPFERLPRTTEQVGVDLVRTDRGERTTARLEHQNRIALVDLTGGDGRHHGHAATLGCQGEECLVLHLFEPSGATRFAPLCQIAYHVAATN